MIMAILSSRIRSWLLFAVLLPVVGRILQALGLRVSERNPRAGSALTKAGGFARQPLGDKRGRSRTAAAQSAPPQQLPR